jgi:phosphatidylserine decarboxylase
MGRIPLDPAGWPFIAGALVLALVSGAAGSRALGTVFAVLAAFFVFFFRDPERRANTAAGDEVVLSPADGRVLVAGSATAETAPPGDWQQVSIFLSATDVHVNRVPVSGRITRVSFTRGRFLPAYRHDAATANERSEIWIDHRGQTIVARQVVGIMARRVVCRLEAGTDVQAGDRLGVMKFGSRMDVFVPPAATLSVSVGQMVRGAETIIAVLH